MYSIMIASLLMLQKPRLPWTDFMAWWPGGRTSAKALSTCPSITMRAALMAPPADIMWDSVVTRRHVGKAEMEPHHVLFGGDVRLVLDQAVDVEDPLLPELVLGVEEPLLPLRVRGGDGPVVGREENEPHAVLCLVS